MRKNHEPSQNERNENIHEKNGFENAAEMTTKKKNENYPPSNRATAKTQKTREKEIDARDLYEAESGAGR